MKECTKTIIQRLIKQNEENLKTITDNWAEGYAFGVHDGYVDVLRAFGIETDEEYYNQ